MSRPSKTHGPMQPQKIKRPTGVSLDAELLSQVDAVAGQLHTSRPEIMRQAAIRYVRLFNMGGSVAGFVL